MDDQLTVHKPHSNFHDEDDEEIIVDHSPSFQHLSKESPSPLLLPPQSPESSWSPSPAATPSHPSLLYCCISSLRRDGDIYSIAVSRDLVLTGSSGRRVYAWQSHDCHARGYLRASSGEVRSMLTFDDLLFTTHKDHKIRIWNMSAGSGNFRARKLVTLPSANHFRDFIRRSIAPQNRLSFKPTTPQHRDIISCMAYYHVERILYTGSYDRTVRTWKLCEKKCVDSFLAHTDHINDMVVNQRSGFLFTCSSDGTVKMWLRVYGETCHVLVKVFSYHTYPIYALALGTSPSQRSFLYSGSCDGCINFWVQEMSSHYKHGGVLEGHQFAVLCLVAVENMVISGSEDSTIRIWRREKRRYAHECLAVLEGHRGPVRCLAVKMQDEVLTSFLVFSASLDQTFKVWRVKLLRDLVKENPPRRVSIGEDELEDSGSFAPTPVLSPSWVKKKLQCRSLK